MKLTISLLSSAAAIVLGWPLIGSLVKSSYHPKNAFTKVPGFSTAPLGIPTRLEFMIKDDAYLHIAQTQSVWVIKQSETEATVFSSICPHLNCRYNWSPEASEFICPCHYSVFAKNGRLISGPARRPLDTLPYKIIDGELYVKWELFKPGIATKERFL